ARRLITLDPLNETSHRILMNVYIQARQHSAALKQYQTLEQTLRKELSLDPQPETRELYKKIRKGDISSIPFAKTVEIVTPKHNLPHQISSFIGRTKEQAEIKSLVQRNRLVTLVGAGGIGKTSLSLELSHSLLDEFPNGVWFIPLDSLSTSNLVPQTVAAVFGIRESSERPTIDLLTNVLRDKNALLILDNCEHLLDACAQLITTLLTNCQNIKFLATSREVLNVTGEATYQMPSLSLPEQDGVSLEELTEYESIRLFTERAKLALSSFKLTDENSPTVMEICHKVEGFPLAIELGAARVNILQVEEILKQLNDSFSLLTSDSRTSSSHHQSLQASIDWSWGLLNNAEQTFLEQLSVFAGGWTFDAAQSVCDGDILDLTNSLVKKSLIVVKQDEGRETRYRFHEMIRQFAFEKLVASGYEEEIRTRYLDYFLGLSEQAEIELRGPSTFSWIERLNDERNNLRTALRWAEKTNLEAGLYIVGRLARYWDNSDIQGGVDWCDIFLQKTVSTDFVIARAQALLAHGWLLIGNQDFSRARLSANECLEISQSTNDKQGEVEALLLIGFIEQLIDQDAANELYNQALELATKMNDTWRKAKAHLFLGWDQRDYERKFRNWEKAIDLFRDVGDQLNLTNLLGLTGHFRVLNGDIEIGERYLQEAIQFWEANKRENVLEHPKLALNYISLIRGDYEKARTRLNEILISAEQMGNRTSYLWANIRLGYVNIHSGDLAEARTIINESIRDFSKDGYGIGVVFALEVAALLYSTIGKAAHAARLLGFSDIARKKIKDPRPPLEQADMDKIIAACLSKMKEEAFSDAYDEGQKMTLDEVVEYALYQSN
ncbi:MAG TPA: BTAD domain-containing putative transcriptional regulator, partial [Anaerolineales bacterium]|nr:BTAD domain-containing putative transcriptional regulator [Anaerolineales bacterium]